MNYHAHIYWHNDQQKTTAIQLRTHLASLGCRLGKIMDQPIGPHPLPMYQANYSDENATEVEQFLSHAGLTVLLHEDTGEHIRDHTIGVRWIGQRLTLDIEWIKQQIG